MFGGAMGATARWCPLITGPRRMRSLGLTKGFFITGPMVMPEVTTEGGLITDPMVMGTPGLTRVPMVPMVMGTAVGLPIVPIWMGATGRTRFCTTGAGAPKVRAGPITRFKMAAGEVVACI